MYSCDLLSVVTSGINFHLKYNDDDYTNLQKEISLWVSYLILQTQTTGKKIKFQFWRDNRNDIRETCMRNS